MRLTPCRSCQRHIVADETTCPFCGARVISPLVAAAALGVALAAAGVACGNESVALYGIPPMPADGGVTDGGQ